VMFTSLWFDGKVGWEYGWSVEGGWAGEGVADSVPYHGRDCRLLMLSGVVWCLVLGVVVVVVFFGEVERVACFACVSGSEFGGRHQIFNVSPSSVPTVGASSARRAAPK